MMLSQFLFLYKALAVASHFTVQCIDDVLSINNCYIHSYVNNSMYTSDFEIKDTTDSETSVSYLDILLDKDVNGTCNLIA